MMWISPYCDLAVLIAVIGAAWWAQFQRPPEPAWWRWPELEVTR